MKRVMIDLETWGTRSDALVISVGACFFDKNFVDGANTFYCVLDPEEQVHYGRKIDPATMTWWLQQSDEARKAITSGARIAPMDALVAFSRWIAQDNVAADEVWGNGADFDCVIWGSLYDSFQMVKPWSFRRNRCFRTLKSMTFDVPKPERIGVHHNALDDALFQAEWASRMIASMEGHQVSTKTLAGL